MNQALLLRAVQAVIGGIEVRYKDTLECSQRFVRNSRLEAFGIQINNLVHTSIDRSFICDTWHHIADHPRYLALMKKMLKPGRQVVMIEFKKAETPVEPPMEMRIDHDDLVKEMETNGFRLEAEHTFLPHQYFLVFKLK
jgi:predicted methyltransferase